MMRDGAIGHVPKDHLEQLAPAIRKALGPSYQTPFCAMKPYG